MTTPLTPRSSAASTSPSIWPTLSRLLWLALLTWIVAGWTALAGHWTPGYSVDEAATLLMTAPLAVAALAATWQAQRHALTQAQQSHQQWLSVLLVRRDQAEQAAETLEALGESLDHLSHLCRQPTAHDAPHSTPTVDATAALGLGLITPMTERERALRPLLHAVRGRLINLHVRIGRGDPIESLSFEVQPLSEEFQQIQDHLTALFEQIEHLQQALHAQANADTAPDLYADLRPWLASLRADLAQTRQLLADTLDRPMTPVPALLDDALGLSRDHA